MDYLLTFLVIIILIVVLFVGYKVFWVGGAYVPGVWPAPPAPRPPAPRPPAPRPPAPRPPAPRPPAPRPPEPFPNRYDCFEITDGFRECIPSEGGMYSSLSHCKTACPSTAPFPGPKPPRVPERHACFQVTDDFARCLPAKNGEFANKAECDVGCGKVPDPSGGLLGQFSYQCDSGKCEKVNEAPNGKTSWRTIEQCQDECKTGSVRWMCDGDQCVVNAAGQYTSLEECKTAGCGKIPHGDKCLFKKDYDPNTDMTNLQNWIDENIMVPMDGMGKAAKQFKWFAKGTGVKLDNSGKQFYKCSVDSNGCLCSVDSSGLPLICQENICPYGTFYDPNENAGDRCQNCPDDPFSAKQKEGFSVRGVKDVDIVGIKKARKGKRKFILTDYSFSGGNIYGPAAGEKGDNIAALLDDMINNFCINGKSDNKVDVYSMYVHTIVEKYGVKDYAYFMDREWVFNNFLKKCGDVGIEPAITIYPDDAWAKQTGWPVEDWEKITNTTSWNQLTSDEKIWFGVGYYINKMNSYSKSKGGPLIKYLVYDSEAVPTSLTDFNGVRNVLTSAPSFANSTDWNTFYLMTSKGPGFKMDSSNNSHDIGLGEVYWNVGQSWPCKGNTSQYSKYTPACKELSSHVAFKDDWKKYLVYLNNSAKAESGGGLSNNYLNKESGKSRTMPLFSTEALYSDVSRGASFKSSAEESGLNFTGCAATAYFSEANKKQVPSMNDKVCGTFDGFSYWTRENFFDFMLTYADMYMPKNDDGVQFIGIYAPAFIPNTWMRGGKFQNQQYAADIDGFPFDCRWKDKNGKPLSDKCGSLRKTCSDTCTDDNDCMKCAPGITGYCKGNGFCHYNN